MSYRNDHSCFLAVKASDVLRKLYLGQNIFCLIRLCSSGKQPELKTQGILALKIV